MSALIAFWPKVRRRNQNGLERLWKVLLFSVIVLLALPEPPPLIADPPVCVRRFVEPAFDPHASLQHEELTACRSVELDLTKEAELRPIRTHRFTGLRRVIISTNKPCLLQFFIELPRQRLRTPIPRERRYPRFDPVPKLVLNDGKLRRSAAHTKVRRGDLPHGNKHLPQFVQPSVFGRRRKRQCEERKS